jgi:hypothetical protein
MPDPITNPAEAGGLLDRALRALAARTGLAVAVTGPPPAVPVPRRPDATVELRWEGRTYRYLVETKTTIDRAVALANAKRQLNAFADEGLLVTEYLTPELARRCRDELQLQFVDAAGNAWLRRPGLYVFVTGEKHPDPPARAAGRGAGTVNALRVVFAVLCRPALLDAPYREIATAAGVALGTVGGVLGDLERRGHLVGTKGQRRLVARERLVDEWATTFPLKLRPRLHPQRFRVANPDAWQAVTLRDGPAAWGGEVAADRLTGNLRPQVRRLYVDPDQRTDFLQNLVVAHGLQLRADPAGDTEILDRFWTLPPAPDHPDCVPPVLVYADLLATLDPRNIEVAQDIRQRFLADAPG